MIHQREMVNGGSGDQGSGSGLLKVYVYWKILPRYGKGPNGERYTGEKWFRSYYYQNAVLKEEWYRAVEKKKKSTGGSSNGSGKKGGSSDTQPRSIPDKPKVHKNPGSFTMTKPKEPGEFKFRDEPVLKEVIIPQKPPEPGPEPKFDYEDRVPVTKLEYLYGIKHLEIKHKQYDYKSIFVSKPMKVQGNVMQVSLHAIEEHPLFDMLSGEAADRQTSVEYYVAYTKSPSLNDWYSILPESQKTIKCELLMFDTARTARLRFPALIGSDPRPVVYKDGLRMKDGSWSFADGGTKVQLLGEYDPVSIYTIDYAPNSEFYDPWTLDIVQKGVVTEVSKESFPSGTNHNKTVVLKEHPYVDYEKVNTDPNFDANLGSYKPIKVTLKESNIIGPNRTTYTEVLPFNGAADQKVFTKNVSDYKEGKAKELKPYSINTKDGSAYNGFEYYQEGNKLFFSETFNKSDIYTNEDTNHGNAVIEVEYEYLVSNFRIKIIQRRNSADENTLTPIVHEYALKFKVMK